jgi:hypothetical protein
MSTQLISINESTISDSPTKSKPEDPTNEKGEAIELAEI